MKKSFVYFVSLILVAGLMSGCSELKKMVDNAKSVTYKSNPDPLEMHAGKVVVNVTVTFPPKYFGKKVKLVITPALKADNGSTEKLFKTQTVQGEKVADNNKKIPYEAGGSYNFKDTIAYDSNLRMSDLELRVNASDNKNNTMNIITVKVCDGIITTPELVTGGMLVDGIKGKGGQTVTSSVIKPQITTDSKDAKIYYDMQQSKVKAGELKKTELNDLITFIKTASANTNSEIKGVKISSYASPDGPEALNQGLVSDRGKNSQTAFKDLMKKQKIEKADKTEFYMTETTPIEDWDGFKALVTASNMKDKELVLRVLQMYTDPIVREREIKNISVAFNELRKDILPQLRRSVIKFEFQTKSKEDAALIETAKTTPDQLKQEELLYAAFAAPDFATKEQIYKSYVAKYPQDKLAWNNLGVAQIELNKFSDAKASFQRVLDIDKNNSAAFNNLGAIAMAEGDDNAAYKYFEQAEAAGSSAPAVGYNMGTILIKRGLYTDAVSKFKDNSFNKALAQTLSGDNSSAASTLQAMGNKDQAIFYYFKAVVAAKGQKEGDVMENLKIAVAKDNTLKEYAKNDLEFRKFSTKEEFKKIVE